MIRVWRISLSSDRNKLESRLSNKSLQRIPFGKFIEFTFSFLEIGIDGFRFDETSFLPDEIVEYWLSVWKKMRFLSHMSLLLLAKRNSMSVERRFRLRHWVHMIYFEMKEVCSKYMVKTLVLFNKNWFFNQMLFYFRWEVKKASTSNTIFFFSLKRCESADRGFHTPIQPKHSQE